MKRSRKHLIGLAILSLLTVLSCQQKAEVAHEDTILTGKADLWVDESILPIVEDEQAVFETQYKGRFTLKPAPETEILLALEKGQGPKLAMLSRALTPQEHKIILKHSITPKATLWGYDGLALVVSKATTDTVMSWQELTSLMKKGKGARFKGLVFDNINSSTAHTLQQWVLGNAPAAEAYSMHNHREVLEYVTQHPGYVGVIGVNWLMQPPVDCEPILDGLHTLYVENTDKKQYFYPSQDEMASGQYPLMRPLYLINVQGYAGLGKGFAAFIAGERGQRILLKSGLVPEKYPSRKLVVRPQIQKDNED